MKVRTKQTLIIERFGKKNHTVLRQDIITNLKIKTKNAESIIP